MHHCVIKVPFLTFNKLCSKIICVILKTHLCCLSQYKYSSNIRGAKSVDSHKLKEVSQQFRHLTSFSVSYHNTARIRASFHLGWLSCFYFLFFKRTLRRKSALCQPSLVSSNDMDGKLQCYYPLLSLRAH